MTPLLYVLIGPAAAAGAIVRYGIDRAITARTQRFGLGIVVTNVLACFLMGLTWQAWAGHGAAWALIATGFLGGMSTFSTAVLDAAVEIRSRPRISLALIALGLAACIGAFVAGAWLMRG
ncbi:CrcB family protein [Nanchangia anserum]|uniref:Fluoride-specific ion channel FluC n=1 Tax=Nanchangia anserum TaxID=2692125 RepID=A0A8I0G9K2_9ACTO|nr:CrcB family protein [Nanchangia anserum]MBD3689669.1 CrcB family protein [Nanchangia anserum]QOX81847.1 CrcB family protein [Nanchangia anserum]